MPHVHGHATENLEESRQKNIDILSYSKTKVYSFSSKFKHAPKSYANKI